jgi:hypothetical protein
VHNTTPRRRPGILLSFHCALIVMISQTQGCVKKLREYVIVSRLSGTDKTQLPPPPNLSFVKTMTTLGNPRRTIH